MKTKTLLFFGLVISGFLFIACSSDDDDTEEIVPDNTVVITEDINSPTTWSGDKIYLIKKWDFYVNNTLTIEPGTIIKFHPTEGPTLTLGGSGVIIADATLAQPVIFTSYKDDAHGGDTNADSSATSPASGDWGYISTNGLNGSLFNYCRFYYGGNNTYHSTLEIDGRATVKNCIFAHNIGDDLSNGAAVLDLHYAIAGTVFSGNIFYDNIYPVSVSIYFDIDDTNIFHNPDDASQTNQFNGIFVYSDPDELSSSLSWEETEVAFVVDDNDWWIESSASLSLANNVVLKFKNNSEVILASGAQINNYNGSGVYFTSYKDDSLKGDTNGDGNATSPANGDWGGIYSDASGTYHNWTNILYDSH